VQATKNCLDAARSASSSHFVLLSAICVQKPLLEFQRAKLKFEGDLQAASDITHSIVRPTAFFKSLAGQVESVKKGGPYVMFGDGHLAACKPISEEDLAAFMADCVVEEDKVNKVPILVLQRCQGEMIPRLSIDWSRSLILEWMEKHV
jgi:divinyl chlorophyllide a 8-vinyl-reductase